jgi:hypothetical protein
MVEEINLIPAEQVPEKIFGRWPTIFAKIPEGQAAVLTSPDPQEAKNYANNIRSQLGQQKARGKFLTLFIRQKDDKVYIVNKKPST